MVVIEMPQLPRLCVGAEPASTPIRKRINRRKQPRLPAELLCVFLCEVVLLQQRHLLACQPKQTFLLIVSNADVLYGICRK